MTIQGISGYCVMNGKDSYWTGDKFSILLDNIHIYDSQLDAENDMKKIKPRFKGAKIHVKQYSITIKISNCK
jgi:hypothetical protein